MGNLTNVFGGYAVPGALGVAPISLLSEFQRQVSQLALDFVYIGVGVFVAWYISNASWIISGDRITRRIQG